MNLDEIEALIAFERPIQEMISFHFLLRVVASWITTSNQQTIQQILVGGFNPIEKH